jgi:transcription termination factor Rho
LVRSYTEPTDLKSSTENNGGVSFRHFCIGVGWGSTDPILLTIILNTANNYLAPLFVIFNFRNSMARPRILTPDKTKTFTEDKIISKESTVIKKTLSEKSKTEKIKKDIQPSTIDTVTTLEKPLEKEEIAKSQESTLERPNLKFTLSDLETKTIAELRSLARNLNIEGVGELNKHDLIIRILSVATQNQGNNINVDGILEIMADGSHGVLRSMHLLPSENDVYVSLSQIRRFNMRMGDFVSGLARLPKDNERYLSLLRVDQINGEKAEDATNRPNFERMKPIFPNKIIKLETGAEAIPTRIIDLLAPIGYGQRGMVVAPPKAGKTTLLKDIAKGVAENHPEVHLMVVLIAERPEEVTDMERFVKGEVFAANFDDHPEIQLKVAELSLERAKRMVESGKDVVILLDSITRLARAYNVVMPTSGRTLSGGMDPIALYPPKRFFGAARNFENGKSLTIIATALVDTGSKMDDVVFEEFKGTGNMELHLDRSLAERRIFPSINIKESGTRNEELLIGKEDLAKIWGIRRLIDEMKPADSLSAIVDRLKKTKSNKEFLDTIHDII